MTVKVKYENGVLKLLEKVLLKDKEIYEIEIKENRDTKIFYKQWLQKFRFKLLA